MKKLLSIIITITMVLSLNAASLEMAFAATGDAPAEETGEGTVTVYFTLSNDGRFVTGNDENETVLCHVPVTISYFDLAEYDMQDYYRYETDSFENGGGYIGDEVLHKPTLLHLYIKMLEKYYLGDGRKLIVGDDDQNALKISGSATSLYMTTFWNHDENLMYYTDHHYPLQAQGWGSTCDYILLEEGMDIDVAMFSDWDFYHTGAFAYYDSPDHTKNEKGQYVTEPDTPITLTMRATATNAAYDGSSSFSGEPMPGEIVTYTKKSSAISEYDNQEWDQLDYTTDDDGNVTMVFNEPGVYYVSSTWDYVNYGMDSGNACVAPPIAEIKVLNADGSDPEDNPGQGGDIDDPDNPGGGGGDIDDPDKPGQGGDIDDPDKPGTGGDVDEPEDPGKDDYTGSLIKSIEFRQTQSKTSMQYDYDSQSKTVTVPDTKSAVSAFTQLSENAPERTKLTASYTTVDGTEKTLELKKSDATGTALTKFLSKNGKGANLTITATCENKVADDNIQTINLTFARKLTLAGISAVDSEGDEVEFDETFNSALEDYNATIPSGVSSIKISATPYSSDYTVSVSGEDTLNPVITVSNGAFTNRYRIHLTKKSAVSQKFKTTDGTVLQVRNYNKTAVCQEKVSGSSYVVNGLMSGKEYTYTATKKGCTGKSGSFIAGETGEIDLTLKTVNVNQSIIADLGSSWNNFRGNDDNNGITTALLPQTYDTAQLYWASKVGEGFGAGAPSSPIIVDDCLVYTTATTIIKADKTTGEILQTGTMSKTSAFNITPPTYADGMIFVALGAGTIQAFNADTLESLWVYHNPRRGQPNCPITYHDGYIYTGFWAGETIKADFVCLSATDEDPSKPDEEKVSTWTYTQEGGFYWAGAYACDNFVLVATDDGTGSDSSGTSSLISFDPVTGKILSRNDNVQGDSRSTICYDSATDKYYFTSKGGKFYAATVDNSGQITLLESIDLGGASSSTPVVYQGRAYIGVNGSEQFGVNAGHSITVVNLEDMTIAYRLLTRGYPQTSGLLTTGYQGVTDDGYIYVYFVDNYEPGKVRVLKDKPGQKEAIITRESEYEDSNDNNVLFTPKNDQANYAICSLICDEDGTMYFKNDSCYMFALGSKINSIEVVKQPEKTEYLSGEVFDPAGMKVVANMANGMQRDITRYVTFSDKPLTEKDTGIQIKYPYISYNDTLLQYQKFPELIAADDVKISVTNAKDIETVKAVVAKINDIPDNPTLADYSKIKAAREAYEALSVSSTVIDRYLTNYSKLQNAEKAYSGLIQEYFDAHPITIKASASEFDSVTLSWKAQDVSFDAFGTPASQLGVVYEVYKQSDKGDFKKIAKTDELTYTAGKLEFGKEYVFVVKSVLMSMDGKTRLAETESNTLTAKPQLGTPVIKSCAQTDANAVKLEWEQVAGADGYIIYRSDSKNGSYKPIYTVGAGDILTHTNTGLICEKPYYYKVKAFRIASGAQALGEKYSDAAGIDALAHVYKDTVKKATFTADGKIASTCEICGKDKAAKTIKKIKTVKLAAKAYTYNGKVRKPAVTVKDSKGKVIDAKNYKITYAKGCKNVGKYTVKITFKGNYSGSKTLSFAINPKGTSIKSLVKGKKCFTVKWNKQDAKMASKRITGYQIRYSLKKSMAGSKTVTVKSYKTVSKKISKLKAKKKYYVQIRTYSVVSKAKYYSSWSKAKTVTTK